MDIFPSRFPQMSVGNSPFIQQDSCLPRKHPEVQRSTGWDYRQMTVFLVHGGRGWGASEEGGNVMDRRTGSGSSVIEVLMSM